MQTLCNITPPHVDRRESPHVMKVSCYVTVDDGSNYVMFHKLNVHVKIKKITKAQLDSVSNREF